MSSGPGMEIRMANNRKNIGECFRQEQSWPDRQPGRRLPPPPFARGLHRIVSRQQQNQINARIINIITRIDVNPTLNKSTSFCFLFHRYFPVAFAINVLAVVQCSVNATGVRFGKTPKAPANGFRLLKNEFKSIAFIHPEIFQFHLRCDSFRFVYRLWATCMCTK